MSITFCYIIIDLPVSLLPSGGGRESRDDILSTVEPALVFAAEALF